MRVEPLGTFRLPNINLTNIRVRKMFNLLRQHRVGVELNVYNAFNVNTVQAWSNRTGASFLRPTSILPPRILEVGAKYTF
jgi:outer membrane receptor protein involved in Fe transport